MEKVKLVGGPKDGTLMLVDESADEYTFPVLRRGFRWLPKYGSESWLEPFKNLAWEEVNYRRTDTFDFYGFTIFEYEKQSPERMEQP